MWVTKLKSLVSKILPSTTCTGVEMFRKLLDEGRAGENVGVLLRGTKREDVERGQVLLSLVQSLLTPSLKLKYTY